MNGIILKDLVHDEIRNMQFTLMERRNIAVFNFIPVQNN